MKNNKDMEDLITGDEDCCGEVVIKLKCNSIRLSILFADETDWSSMKCSFLLFFAVL